MNRLANLLERHRPDIVCLQETKVTDKGGFPFTQLGALGYQSLTHGQLSHNGVAILISDPAGKRDLLSFNSNASKSKSIATDVIRGFPGDPSPHDARVISACIDGVRIVNAYIVNGQSEDSEQFTLKEKWMASLGKWLSSLAVPLMVIGDFNVCPDDRDVWDPEGLRDRIHCTKQERKWLLGMQAGRLIDLVRLRNDGKFYTWWPYQKGAFERDEGLRFDGALGDESLARAVERVWADKEERSPTKDKEIPSDHAPLVVDLADNIFKPPKPK